VILLVSGGSSAIICFRISLPFLPKGSDTSETTKPYLHRLKSTKGGRMAYCVLPLRVLANCLLPLNHPGG